MEHRAPDLSTKQRRLAQTKGICMFRTPKVGTRALAGIATIATLTGVSLPLMATAASAASTAVTVDPASKTANNRTAAYQGAAADNTHVITGTLTNDATATASTIRYIITSGPNADQANNGANAADGLCTTPTATTFSCTVNNTPAGKTGVDTIRVFADLNNDQIYQSASEPSDTATKTWSGVPFTVAMTPDADTAATGTCNPFTVVLKDQGGNPVAAGTRVDVTVTQTSPAPTTTASTVSFCDPAANGGPGGTNSQAAPNATTLTVVAPNGVSGEYVTDDAGTATFGITSTTASTHTVTAFAEDTDNDTLNAGEPNDTSTKTFTAGGAAGVTSVVAAPKTATRFIGSVDTFTATLKNSTGDTVSGVTPLADITSGPNAAVTPTCGASNQAGVSTCTYTAGTTTGTDAIVVWIQQASGGTPGPDASEPKDTLSVTYVAGAAGTAIDLVCTGTAAGGTAAVTTPAPGTDAGAEENCVSPTSRATETFTAYVTVPDGPDAGTAPDPAANVPVNFTLNSGGPGTADATLSATTVTTDAAGKAVVTVTNPNPAVTDNYSVTASTATNNSTVTDTAFETYQARTTTTVAVTPASATNQVDTQHTVTGTVKDQFGDPIANQAITFNVSGRNTRTSVGLTTGASGTATFSYTDTGSSTTGGTDSITATSGTVTSPAASKFWITEAPVPGQVILDVDSAGGTGGPCETAAPEKSLNAALASNNAVCATVRTTSGTNVLAGQSVTFTITGVGTFANGTKTFTTTANSSGQATATATSTASGTQTIKVTAGTVSDTGTITYATPTPDQARNIDLKPDTSTLTNGSHELTALVTDRYGNPVPGLQIDFTENGPGQFSNGTSSISGTTGSTGTVSVTFTSPAGSTGTDTVTAAISGGQFFTDCTLAAGNPAGTTTAGNCSDTSTYTLQSGQAPTISVSPTALNVGQYATVVVHGTAGQAVQLLAYSRPSTTYIVVRNGTIGSNGTTTFSVGPRTNTRLFAKTASGSSTSAVISVRPAESLFGTTSGKVGSFHGGIVPGHGGVTVRLFTVKNGVRSASPVGTAVTDANGHWTYSRTFAATGYVTFISQTLSDLTNLSGQSNRITVRFS
jgi:hypothetical protein